MISIIIPARNEEETIVSTLLNVIEHLRALPYEIIVVNDHSSDKTVEVVKNISLEYTQVRLITNNFSPGLAGTLKKGFSEAMGEVVVPVMADLCDDPETIRKMYEKIREGYDVVCGSRYMKGGGREGGPFLKGVLSRWVGKTTRFFTGIPTHDATNAFKMYRKETIANLKIESKGFEIFLEIPLKLYFQGCRITEVPTVWRARSKGKSKFSSWQTLIPYLKWLTWGFSRRLLELGEK